MTRNPLNLWSGTNSSRSLTDTFDIKMGNGATEVGGKARLEIRKILSQSRGLSVDSLGRNINDIDRVRH